MAEKTCSPADGATRSGSAGTGFDITLYGRD
jgi:hypothetical protein